MDAVLPPSGFMHNRRHVDFRDAPEVLESNPIKFLNHLELCTEHDVKINFGNTPRYHNWWKCILGCLVVLVGELVVPSDGPFYGAQTRIPDDLGVRILEALLKHDIELNFRDYYGETPLECLKTRYALIDRHKNDRFILRLVAEYLSVSVARAAMLRAILGLYSTPDDPQ